MMRTTFSGFRLEPRSHLPRHINWTVPIGSFFAALLAGALLLLVTGQNPISVYQRILERAFLDTGSLSGTLIAATPLLFTGLCAAVAFRVGFFNIGGEGQFYIGAIFSSGIALALGRDAQVWIAIPAMIIAGALGGALWAAIPGVLRAYLRTNEIITSLMLNYIAGVIAVYLIFESSSFWRDLEGTGKMFPKGKVIPEVAFWPEYGIGSLVVPFGFVFGIATAAWIAVLQRRTRFGYEMRVVGGAPTTARYAGMRPGRVIVAVAAVSGALAGLGGAASVGNFRHILDPKGMQQSGFGYAGIVVAALARLNPVAVIFVSIIIGGITNAGYALQGPDFPSGLVGILEGLILFCTLGGEVLMRYRVVRTRGVSSNVVGAQ
ncbi:MAG TPA: ABC transporter permease [Acidimicrobiaceae bacterium]|nr:ABC transporter permease [Acidimicrobiaceae bacterium]